MNYKLFNLKVFGDYRESLVSLENNQNLSFDIKVYYIYEGLEA